MSSKLFFTKDSESITDFFTRVSINQIRSLGENLREQKMIEKNSRSLTIKFDIVTTAIKEFKDLRILSVNELMGSLLVYEQRINKSLGETSVHSLQMRTE